MGSVKRILLTGANGFLGSRILKQLINEGYNPVILLRKNANIWRIENLIPEATIFYLEDDRTNLSEVFHLYQISSIIHTATNYGRDNFLSDILNTNVIFPIQLIELGIRNGLELFINTDTYFGKPSFNQTYLNNYTNSKRILEDLLKSMPSKIAIRNIRLEHIYGEEDSDSKFVSSIFNQLKSNVKEILLTEGNQKRDFLYVDDAADAYVVILKNYDKTVPYKEYEVGTGKSISIRSFVELMANHTGSNSILNFGGLPHRHGDIEDSFANVSEIFKLGWAPRYAANEGINEMMLKHK